MVTMCLSRLLYLTGYKKSNQDLPVHVVTREASDDPTRTLHRNLFPRIGSLPLEEEADVSPSDDNCSRRYTTINTAILDHAGGAEILHGYTVERSPLASVLTDPPAASVLVEHCDVDDPE
ncbi:hypothetical protein LSH36_540g01019 [Paralvinella palmiformis]|uniref:Uncharacterized protein n=1 Tax=Paralvinella palmiformis TaxID=53620 RepID=A0AAD9J879_9ANNE|nr:hypothetical protein LSH36_540g01019 [Paralvinella palmiformis]